MVIPDVVFIFGENKRMRDNDRLFEMRYRIVRNGFYCIGDVIKSYNMTWIVWWYDDDYYYCIPQ